MILMNRTPKDYLKFIAAVFTFFAILFFSFFLSRETKKIDKQNTSVNADKDNISYRDAFNREHARSLDLIKENSINAIKIDSIEKELKIKEKQIISLNKTTVTLGGNTIKTNSFEKIDTIYIDTTKVFDTTYCSEYKDDVLSGEVCFKKNEKSFKIKYNPIFIDLELVYHFERKRLFGIKFMPRIGKKIFKTDASVRNLESNIKITTKTFYKNKK